jgi:hypothetical protein
VVVDPRLAEYLPAETALGVVPVPVGVLALAAVEGVRGGADAEDRLARTDVIGDVLHLIVG